MHPSRLAGVEKTELEVDSAGLNGPSASSLIRQGSAKVAALTPSAAWLLLAVHLLVLGAYSFGVTRSAVLTFATANLPQYTVDFAGLGMVLTTACAIGWLALGRLRLRCDSLVEQSVYATALGLGVLSLFMLGLGLLSLYKPWVIWLTLVAGTAWGGTVLRSGRLRGRLLPHVSGVDSMVLASSVAWR